MKREKNQKLGKVVRVLRGFGVEPSASWGDQVAFRFDGGVTNHFLQLDRSDGRRCLVRLNGQLWPPFTRADEAQHL